MAEKSLPKEEVNLPAGRRELPKPELDLPKPQADLPLPEKELPAGENENLQGPTSQGETLQGKAETQTTHPFHVPLKFFVLLFVVLLFLASGYVLLQNNAGKTSISPSPTLTTTVNRRVYQNPPTEYSIKYPTGWTVENNLKGRIASSPDFKWSDQGMGAPLSGAKISVILESTTESSVDTEFKKGSLLARIAKNIRYSEVDGQRAIIYDISYETTTATVIRFIKNGLSYSIEYRYANQESKQKWQSAFDEAVSTFKFTQ